MLRPGGACWPLKPSSPKDKIRDRCLSRDPAGAGPNCQEGWNPHDLQVRASEGNEKKWYVVIAVSGQENKIKTYIENEIARLGFEDYVDEVLVPTEKVIKIRNGKKINKEKVYLFCR